MWTVKQIAACQAIDECREKAKSACKTDDSCNWDASAGVCVATDLTEVEECMVPDTEVKCGKVNDGEDDLCQWVEGKQTECQNWAACSCVFGFWYSY